MKILHLLASNKFSGAEHIAVDIIRALQEKYELVYVSPTGEIKEFLGQEKIRYIPLNELSYLEVYRVIKDYKPDIIHAHDYRASCIAAFLPFRGKIISHIHNNNNWAKKLNLFTFLYYLALQRIDRVITVSDSVINEFIFCKAMKKKATIIKNAINIEYISKNYLKEKQDKKYFSDILFVGRLAEEKDPLRFIEIVKAIKEIKKDICIRIIGTGILIDEVRDAILKFDLQRNIEILGFKSNPYIYMKNTKLLMMTSKWEGFGLVAIEAMLLGTPVLGTGVGGLKNIIENYCSDWVCQSNEAFVNKSIEILDNKSDFIDEEKIKKYAEELNAFGEFVGKFDSLYKE